MTWTKQSTSAGTNPDARFSGLVWNALGDSITAGTGASFNPFHKRICTKLGMTFNNYGVGGDVLAYNDAYCTANNKQSMVRRYSTMAANADIITVMGGTNDAGVPVPLGVMGDTVDTTYYGALDTLCKGLIDKYPGKMIIFFTPPPCADSTRWTSTKSYADAVIEVTARYSIHCYDLFRRSGLHPQVASYNTAYFWNGDGIHPNDTGHDIVAKVVEGYLKGIM